MYYPEATGILAPSTIYRSRSKGLPEQKYPRRNFHGTSDLLYLKNAKSSIFSASVNCSYLSGLLDYTCFEVSINAFFKYKNITSHEIFARCSWQFWVFINLNFRESRWLTRDYTPRKYLPSNLILSSENRISWYSRFRIGQLSFTLTLKVNYSKNSVFAIFYKNQFC